MHSLVCISHAYLNYTWQQGQESPTTHACCRELSRVCREPLWLVSVSLTVTCAGNCHVCAGNSHLCQELSHLCQELLHLCWEPSHLCRELSHFCWELPCVCQELPRVCREPSRLCRELLRVCAGNRQLATCLTHHLQLTRCSARVFSCTPSACLASPLPRLGRLPQRSGNKCHYRAITCNVFPNGRWMNVFIERSHARSSPTVGEWMSLSSDHATSSPTVGEWMTLSSDHMQRLPQRPGNERYYRAITCNVFPNGRGMNDLLSHCNNSS